MYNFNRHLQSLVQRTGHWRSNITSSRVKFLLWNIAHTHFQSSSFRGWTNLNETFARQNASNSQLFVFALAKYLMFLFYTGEKTCKSQVFAGIAWNKTVAGETNTRPCPGKSTGRDYITMITESSFVSKPILRSLKQYYLTVLNT